VVDNTTKLAENELERVLKQAEMTEVIQKTIGVIQHASLAYQEQNGMLSYLDESQQKVIENFIAMNEATLRNNDLSVESQNKLFELGKSISDVFVNARKSVEDEIKGMNLTPADEMAKLGKVKDTFKMISEAIPKDMFDLDKNGDIDKTIIKLERMVTTASKFDDDTSFATMHRALMNVGISAEEATQFIGSFAREQENSRLYS